MSTVIHWLVAALAVFIAAYILPGVEVDTFFAAFVAAVVIGLVNTFIRPIILLLTLPINILTLGLFTLVINALLVLLAARIVPGFDITGFWWAFAFSIVLWLINILLGVSKKSHVSNNNNAYY